MNSRRPKMLLHMCCAGCSPYVIELLRKDYDVTGYFYNPNIHPEEEYRLRLSEAKNLASKLDVEILCGEYDANEWLNVTEGMEHEPEGGGRCNPCFRMRLEKTARCAREGGFVTFTTTLTVSPHKDAERINEIGLEASKKHGVDFLQSNFKKQDGFKKTLALSKHFELYRQDYCGCLFSQRRSE